MPNVMPELPYLVVTITKGENLKRFASGKERETVKVTGDALWQESGEPPVVENTSDWTHSDLLIEMKK